MFSKGDKFAKYLREGERLQFLAALVRDARLTEIMTTIAECRDPKDDKFLELATSGEATCMVSGDDDLLVLNPFRGIPVLSPKDFAIRTWGETD